MNYKQQIITEITKALNATDQSQIQNMIERIHQSNSIFCDGLGRSSLAMRGFAMRLMQLGFHSSMVGEVTAPAFRKNELLLICTASGTSSVLLHHAEQARKQGGRVAIITGNPTSPLASIADDMLLIQASNKDSSNSEKVSIQPMGSLFEQTSWLICDTMALMLMEQFDITADDMRKRHANIE